MSTDRIQNEPYTYAQAGVSIAAGNALVKAIAPLARATRRPGADADLGGFGGFFDLKAAGFNDPLLVAANDGVGTKVKLAIDHDRHDAIGIDLVAMCVNDVLVQGAESLFFLDYFATGKLEPDVTASVVEGMARACRENGCVLLGGETAEMPDFYPPGEYDLAGFIVGVVDKAKVIDGKSIVAGDVVLGLPSTGLQTNGYSLARKLFFEVGGYKVDSYIDELGTTVGESLLATHSSFLPEIGPLLVGTRTPSSALADSSGETRVRASSSLRTGASAFRIYAKTQSCSKKRDPSRPDL